MNLKDFFTILVFFVVLVIFLNFTGAVIVVGLLLLVSFFKSRKINKLLKGDILFKGSVVGSVTKLKHDSGNKDLITKKKINEQELGKTVEMGHGIDDFNIVFKENSFYVYRRKINILSFLIKTYFSSISCGNLFEINYSDIVDYYNVEKKRLSLKIFVENNKKDRLFTVHILCSDNYEPQKDVEKLKIESVNEKQINDLIKIIERKTNLSISDNEFFEPFTKEGQERKIDSKTKEEKGVEK
ncbi:MAG: hypothetical protein KKA79_07480 [Nanoarchaeota archaeon]|nr:hypothetical protein [Nanoarchaeota archaeon]